jgi:hypothetical protein
MRSMSAASMGQISVSYASLASSACIGDPVALAVIAPAYR